MSVLPCHQLFPVNVEGEGKKNKNKRFSSPVTLLFVLYRDRKQYEAIPEQLAWTKEQLMYNTVGGKLNRGMGVVDVLRAFAEKEGRELRHEEVSAF